MGDTVSAVERTRLLANAYREALAEGDRQLTGNALEHKFLLAIVAESADDAMTWVQTRVPDGHTAAKPLEELAPALAKGNVVGASVREVKKVLLSQAKSLALAAVGPATVPLWIASVLTFLFGLFGAAQDAGTTVGTAIAPLILGGVSSTYAIVRTLQASSGLTQAVGAAAGSLLDTTERLGWRAESIFLEKVSPAFGALMGTTGLRVPAVLGQVRGGAKLVVLLAYGALALCLLFFVYGMWNAFSAALATPIAPSTCQVTGADGSCLFP